MESDRLSLPELQGSYSPERSTEYRNPNSPEELRGASVPMADDDCRSITRTPRNSFQQDEALMSSYKTDISRVHDVVESHNVVTAVASDSEEAACDERKGKPPLQRKSLDRSVYSLVLVALYATLVVFAWAVLCIITQRPIMSNMRHYGVSFDTDDTYIGGGQSYFYSIFTRSDRYLQAAQSVRSATTLVTIPLILTVCSKAAVAVTQRRGRQALSLRQTMTLADRGWTDPTIYFQLLSGGYKQRATKFLILAILLTLLGGMIAPLQSFYLSTTTIKRPTSPELISDLVDMQDLTTQTNEYGLDGEGVVQRTRVALTASNNAVTQGRLWSGQSINCSTPTSPPEYADRPEACRLRFPGKTLGNMSLLPDPFLAQLPSDYGTGLIRQYLPRINSTAQRNPITESEFPSDCESQPGAFYVKYGAMHNDPDNKTGWRNWSMVACMPADSVQPPWRATRNRQDFVEHLYMNLSSMVTGLEHQYDAIEVPSGYFRVTVHTSAGYFELPNYLNGQQPGPLLTLDPTGTCGFKGTNCRLQNPARRSQDYRQDNMRRDGNNVTVLITNETLSLDTVSNRGPLLTTALALFGTGSFIEERMARPEAYLYPNLTWEEYRSQPNPLACIGEVPFIGLLSTETGAAQTGGVLGSGCLTRDVHNYDHLQQQIIAYVRLFYRDDSINGPEGERITNAFASAAFLANEAWLTSGSHDSRWWVSYDYGADAVVPAISSTGVLVISVLMGLFLTILLGLATYTAVHLRWTDQLDSFAMLRIGASMSSNDVQLRPTTQIGKIKALDELPGWIGDATEGEGENGQLALGGRGCLKGRMFEVYDADPGT